MMYLRQIEMKKKNYLKLLFLTCDVLYYFKSRSLLVKVECTIYKIIFDVRRGIRPLKFIKNKTLNGKYQFTVL